MGGPGRRNKIRDKEERAIPKKQSTKTRQEKDSRAQKKKKKKYTTGRRGVEGVGGGARGDERNCRGRNAKPLHVFSRYTHWLPGMIHRYGKLREITELYRTQVYHTCLQLAMVYLAYCCSIYHIASAKNKKPNQTILNQKFVDNRIIPYLSQNRLKY